MAGFDLSRMNSFDVESTGIDLENDRIVTMSMVTIEPGTEPLVRSWLLNPGVDIPEQATAVHGITTEHAREHGEDPAEVLHDVVCLLGMCFADPVLPLVGMNCVFDLTILDRECRRHGVPTLADRVGAEQGTGGPAPIAPVIDVMCIDKAIDRFRKGKRTLTDLCNFYGARIDGAHDSAFDALAAARVAWKMAHRTRLDADALHGLYADRKYPHELVRAWQRLGAMSLTELHDAQVGWYAEQAESFGQYLRREANQARHRADTAEDDEARGIALQEAAEIDARVDGLSSEWPVRRLDGAT